MGIIVTLNLSIAGIFEIDNVLAQGSSGNIEILESRFFTRTDDQIVSAKGLLPTTDGGYLIGSRSINESSFQEFWLIKTDNDGIEQWNKSYRYSLSNYPLSFLTDLAQTPDNGYAVLGTTETDTNWDAWLLKLDSNGIEEWNHSYDGSEHEIDWASAIQVTTDDGFLIGGLTEDPEATANNPLYDYWLIKTDPNGTVQWNKTYDGLGQDEAFSLVPTKDGNYLLCGVTASSVHGVYQTWLLKMNSNGTILWEQYYNTGQSLIVIYDALLETEDGGILLAGYTADTAYIDYMDINAGTAFYIIKTNSTGEVEWELEVDDYYKEQALDVIQSPTGDYYISGFCSRKADLEIDMCIFKISQAGDLLWDWTYGEPTTLGGITDMLLLESVDGHDILLALGCTNSFEADGDDVWLAKLKTNDDPTVDATNFPRFYFVLFAIGVIISFRRKRR
jgi:hypothetical protein